ncbi:hypothetical protein ACFL45_05965 [Candidatus Neomarinimicrobiota bacterium]
MLKYRDLFRCIFLMSMLVFCSSMALAQTRWYDGPDDPAADRAAMREGVMDGNQMLMIFRNNTQIGYKYMIDGSKWPRDSETGLQIFDVLSVLVGAEVAIKEDTIPVTDEAELADGNGLDTLYFVETIWNYDGMLDKNPEGDLIWGFHAVPGYINELSETPAISNDDLSWPVGGWPSQGDDVKWPGEWNGRFGRGVKYAQLESYFVANDAQDQEYIYGDRRVKYYPRPGVFIGDKNLDVTVQKGMPWGGLGLRVEVRGYQWENPQTRDVIFWEYNISNISEYDLARAAFGFFMDVGVGNAYNFWDDGDDLGGFVEESDMAYVWDSNNAGAGGYPTGTIGLAFLESPGIAFDGIDNDSDGLIDEKRDNLAVQKIGPTDGIADLPAFLEAYGMLEEDLKEHWDADEDQDWTDGNDADSSGFYDNGETAGDDVGLDGVGPGELNYYGPDDDGTEGNHKPDLEIGINSEPNFGLTDISESDMLGLTSFHFIPWPGDNAPAPAFDRALFELYAYAGYEPYTGAPADYAPIFGSGRFRLEKGTTERISCALMGAFESVPSLNAGNPPYGLIERKKIVQLIYESDYRFAKPPAMPTLKATGADGKVILTWDNAAELFTREPLLGGENDFEGYKLYKSTNRSFSDAARVYDGHGNPSGKVPVFQCDIKNEYFGFTDYALIQGESYFLGYNTGLRNYYVDEDVENGRTYYYYLTAYDHGIKGIAADIAPSENVFSITVDEQENVVWTGPNVAVVTPHQKAAGYIAAEIEVTHDDIKGTGVVSLEVLSEADLKPGNEYKLRFLVDTLAVLAGGVPFPQMAYQYKNAGFEVVDVTDSNNVIIRESTASFSNDNIIEDAISQTYYLNPEISTNPFDGIIMSFSELSTLTAAFDTTLSGWITGNAPISLTINAPGYLWFPWQNHIVFTSGDITYATSATNLGIRASHVPGIPSYDKDLLLPGTYNMYVENTHFQDDDGNNVLLDMVAHDTNENGSYDLLEDDMIVGYSAIMNDEMKWLVTVFSFNLRDSTLILAPSPGDVYRVDGQRPMTADDEFFVKVTVPTEEMALASEDLSQVKVVPNPYIVTNVMEPSVRNIFLNQKRRLMFTHIPAQCEIKIFTISGYLVDEIDVDNEADNGIVHWDLLTREGLEIAPGVYVYHLVSTATGKEKVGKFAVIK